MAKEHSAEKAHMGAYAALLERIKDVARLQSVASLLEWDQETYMPKSGVQARAEQTSVIAGLAHERLVADETRRLLDTIRPLDDDFAAATNVREARRAFDRASRVPTSLVKQLAETGSLAKDAWARAKARSDFSMFAPFLGKLVELKKQVAEHIGYDTEPYDALLDEFEPGARASAIDALFAELRKATVELLQRILGSAHKPDATILTRRFPRDRQEKFCRMLAESLSFNFEAGRADVSVHPFCNTIGGPGDVRITTRYSENFLPAAMFGTMHEVGHALYEQGLPSEHLFTPMAEAASVGIHESQSRLWENFVGRSRAFWTHFFPPLRDLFPEALTNVALDDFYRAVNAVAPSFIRVEADELTYNLHIILRFELERDLFSGRIQPSDLPDLWRKKMNDMLGISPPDDARGCLQDIHWSMGIFGYFPTYTLGNLYAAQFFRQAELDIPGLHGHISANCLQPLLDWLREKIHKHGKRYQAGELIQRLTGAPLSIQPFMNYVTRKYSEVYGL